jgi:hypothetical protein
MSPEREQQAFEALLRQELTRPGTLVQTLVYGPEQAVEVMRLAARQYRRALRTTQPAVADDDPDQVYALIYEAVRAASAALVHANGYRVRGGERSHVEVLRLAALGLAAWHPEEARLLERIRMPITRARNEMMYSRPRVVTIRELRQFFEAASRLLPALQDCVERKIRQPSLLPAGAWAVPDLPRS